jgi:hypothetical protein
MTMLLRALAIAVLLLTTPAAADDSSIDVDDPIFCLSLESLLEVKRYYIQEGFVLANAYADYAPECFRLKQIDVTPEARKEFIQVGEGPELRYGYIPYQFGPFFTLHLFFMTIIGRGEYI